MKTDRGKEYLIKRETMYPCVRVISRDDFVVSPAHFSKTMYQFLFSSVFHPRRLDQRHDLILSFRPLTRSTFVTSPPNLDHYAHHRGIVIVATVALYSSLILSFIPLSSTPSHGLFEGGYPILQVRLTVDRTRRFKKTLERVQL